MNKDDQDTAEKSYLFYPLVATAGGFFAVALTGICIFAYIISNPRSQVAQISLNILVTGQGTAASSGLGSVLNLLIGGIGAAGSLSLSLALAAIYLSQNQILNTQTSIQESQSKIMKRQKLPAVAAHESGVHLYEGKPTLEGVDSDGKLDIKTTGSEPYVCVAVENHGEEAAEQIQLSCLVDVPSDDEPQIHTGVTELTVDGMFTKPPRGEGALLPPTEDLALLRGTPILSSDPSDVEKAKMFVSGIEDQLQKFRSDESAEETSNGPCQKVVRFGFVLIFTNSVNQKFKIPLESAYSISVDQIDKNTNLTLSTLDQHAIVYDIDELMEEANWSIPDEVFVERGSDESFSS